jgi:ribosomal protein L20
MKFNWKNSLFLLAFSTSLFSCDEETTDVTFPTLEVPTTYESTNYESNASTELAVRSNLSALVSKMQVGRTGTKVSESELLALFNAANPSLKSITTSYYAEKTPVWLAELAKASGGTFNPTTAPAGNGGVYGGYLFDENGLEMEQVVEKGLFGAALYNHALTVIKSNTIAASDIDRLVAIFGAHPSFQNSDAVAQNKDVFSAKYAARRDKNDGKGFYTSIKTNLITAKTAIEKGQNYNQDRDKALSDFRYNWEKSNMATVINYLSFTISKLNKSNATDTDKASALHAYGEAVGLVHGWKGVSANDKAISDAELDQILELMNVPKNGAATSYKFVTEPFTQLPKLQSAIDKLKEIYKFSTQEIIDFDYNWVNEQGR